MQYGGGYEMENTKVVSYSMRENSGEGKFVVSFFLVEMKPLDLCTERADSSGYNTQGAVL